MGVTYYRRWNWRGQGWNLQDERRLGCALPAVSAVGFDDAAPGRERLVAEDDGGATGGCVGQQLPARGQHGARVAAGRDPVRVGDLAAMVHEVAEIVERRTA